jgi:poly-gamma-glutamate synthesis protein (capsule biosynthesis protein)
MQDWALVGPPEVARDLRSFGFNLMSRANNHAVDWSVEGMRQTGRWLDEAGIVHAGVGESLAEARCPRYVSTPKGRIGLVSFHTTTRSDGSQAMDQVREIPARPGFSSLRLRLSVGLPGSALEELRHIERLLDPIGMNSVADPGSDGVTLFDTRFERSDRPSISFEAFPEDVAELLYAVRSGRQLCDLLIVSAHVHEEGPDADTQPSFLSDLAHALVDSGADVFIGHGVHRLWPVEVYRGRPILYGLGNFIFDDAVGPLPPNLYDDARHHVDPTTATDADVIEALNQQYFDDERYFESTVALLHWRHGAIRTTLYPVELGFGMGITRRGLPRLARGDRAQRILERVARQSKAIGTDIMLQDGTALILSSEPQQLAARPE